MKVFTYQDYLNWQKFFKEREKQTETERLEEAKKMLADRIPVEIIAWLTGLSKEKVNKLKS